jgi:hypothetical protein
MEHRITTKHSVWTLDYDSMIAARFPRGGEAERARAVVTYEELGRPFEFCTVELDPHLDSPRGPHLHFVIVRAEDGKRFISGCVEEHTFSGTDPLAPELPF